MNRRFSGSTQLCDSNVNTITSQPPCKNFLPAPNISSGFPTLAPLHASHYHRPMKIDYVALWDAIKRDPNNPRATTRIRYRNTDESGGVAVEPEDEDEADNTSQR